MVQPIENETRLRGTVRQVLPPTRDGFLDVVLAIEAADDVEGRANLLRDRVGQELTITAEAASAAELVVDQRVVVDAELRGPGAVWSRPGGLGV